MLNLKFNVVEHEANFSPQKNHALSVLTYPAEKLFPVLHHYYSCSLCDYCEFRGGVGGYENHLYMCM